MTTRGLRLAITLGAALVLRAGTAGAWGMPPQSRGQAIEIPAYPSPLTVPVSSSPLGSDSPAPGEIRCPTTRCRPGFALGRNALSTPTA
jgi:hypothetical protein